MGWQPVLQRWLDSPAGDILPATNWLPRDITGDPDRTVRVVLTVALSGPTRIDAVITGKGVTKILQLNDGTLLGADDFFVQAILIPPGFSFNLQHEVGTINPAIFINKEVPD